MLVLCQVSGQELLNTSSHVQAGLGRIAAITRRKAAEHSPAVAFLRANSLAAIFCLYQHFASSLVETVPHLPDAISL